MNLSVDVDYLLAQIFCGDIHIVVALPLFRNAAHTDGLGGTVLQAAETADAVFAEAGFASQKRDIAFGTELHALAAGYTGVAGSKFGGSLAGELGHHAGLEGVDGVGAGGPVLAPDIIDVVCNDGGQLLGADLGLGGVHGRHHHAVGEKPDAGALVADAGPIVQRHDAVDDAKADTGIAGVADDAEGVGRGGNFYLLHMVLHSGGNAACIAGEDKAHFLGLLHVGDGGSGAHHDDVRIPQTFGNIFGDVQAVAAAGIAEDDVFAHGSSSVNINVLCPAGPRA